MKRKSVWLIVLTFTLLVSVGIILSETMGHIPITHDHSTSVCYGYAQGRAFGKSAADLECDPARTFAEKIDEIYFPFVADPTLASIRVGDIVVFGTVRSFPAGHAAFVVEVPVPLVINNIRVDQVPNQDSSEQRGVLLSTVRQAQGDPVGYHRGTGGTGVAVSFRNSFDGGSVYVGKDKFGNWRPRPSGWTGEFFQGSQLEMMAISPQQDNAGNRQRFLTWLRGTFDLGSENPRTEIIPGSVTYTADFSIEWDVTFQNNFIGASGGQIKVNGQLRPAPHVSQVLEKVNPSITAEAITNEIDRVSHTFAQWNDGSTVNPRTFAVGNHATYTAHYNARPLPTANIAAGGPIGSNVCVTWQVHPHPQVTIYQIWRKVKHQRQGTTSPPVLLTTLPRTSTQFIDYDYVVTEGYTHDLVWYDVRSYYSPNSTYSDENWTAVYGDGSILPKIASTQFTPVQWHLGNSPNPFNPSTRIIYSLPEGGSVSLVVYDVQGREVTSLVDGYREAGYYSATWDGRNGFGSAIGSGAYFARLNVTNSTGKALYAKTIKLLLAR